MSPARWTRRALIAVAFALSVLAVPRTESILADPPWGWHVTNEMEALIGMFVVPFGAVLLSGMFAILPVLPPDGPVQTDEAYEWRVTLIVTALLLVHVWALLPVFGIYLL